MSPPLSVLPATLPTIPPTPPPPSEFGVFPPPDFRLFRIANPRRDRLLGRYKLGHLKIVGPHRRPVGGGGGQGLLVAARGAGGLKRQRVGQRAPDGLEG